MCLSSISEINLKIKKQIAYKVFTQCEGKRYYPLYCRYRYGFEINRKYEAEPSGGTYVHGIADLVYYKFGFHAYLDIRSAKNLSRTQGFDRLSPYKFIVKRVLIEDVHTIGDDYGECCVGQYMTILEDEE